jgi:hypothetical protein
MQKNDSDYWKNSSSIVNIQKWYTSSKSSNDSLRIIKLLDHELSNLMEARVQCDHKPIPHINIGGNDKSIKTLNEELSPSSEASIQHCFTHIPHIKNQGNDDCYNSRAGKNSGSLSTSTSRQSFFIPLNAFVSIQTAEGFKVKCTHKDCEKGSLA